MQKHNTDIHCTKCKSSDVRRSSRRGIWAALLAYFGFWPYRCRSCQGRFFLRNRHFSPLCPSEYGVDGSH